MRRFCSRIPYSFSPLPVHPTVMFQQPRKYFFPCNSFVTHPTLRWSYDTKVPWTRTRSQLRRADLPLVARQSGPSSRRGRGGGQKGVEELQNLNELWTIVNGRQEEIRGRP